MTLVWEEVPLAKHHDRSGFDCGDADLNIYLQRYARQNHDHGGAKCFVAVPANTPTQVLGFYTLSPASIEYSRTPAHSDDRDHPFRRIATTCSDRSRPGRRGLRRRWMNFW